MTLDNVASRAPCHKLHATVCSAGRSNLGTRTILVARGSLVRSSSPSIVRRRSRWSLPRLHLRQGFLYAAFCLPLSDYRISSARLFRRRGFCEHPHLRARCLPSVQKDAPGKSGYRRSLGRRANRHCRHQVVEETCRVPNDNCLSDFCPGSQRKQPTENSIETIVAVKPHQLLETRA